MKDEYIRAFVAKKFNATNSRMKKEYIRAFVA